MDNIDRIKYIGGKKASKMLGVHQRTLYNWENQGKIETVRTPGGKRLYNVNKYLSNNNKLRVIIRKKYCYCRVSSYGQKDDLQRQIKYMKKKYPDYEIIRDIGSGINLNRYGLNKIIDEAINGEIEEVVVAYKDRLSRFGFEMIERIIDKYSHGKITVLNKISMDPETELTTDLVQIMNVFTAKMNGIRKYKLKKNR